MLSKKLSRLKWIGITIIFLFAASALWLRQVVTDIPAALNPDSIKPKGFLIDNVRLISMAPHASEAEETRSILILDDSIAAVGAAGSLKAPAGVEIVNGRGYTLIPGLIDAHIHLSDEAELAGYLAHGVTGVRNMSGYPFHLKLAERIVAGELIAPDFKTTGPILNSHGPNENLLQKIVTTGDEARAAVRSQYDAGYRAVKVYSNLTRNAYEAILDEANLLGMSITGHSPEGVRKPGVPHEKPFDIPWEASLGRGFTTLEHVETIVWHSLRDDLSEDKMRDVAAKIAASGDVVTPTLIAHRRLVSIAETQGAYLNRPGSNTINPLVRLMERGSEEHWSHVDPSHYEGPHAEFFLTATGILFDEGVPLIAGTDAGGFGIIPGASMARELELLVQAGLTPYEALAAATRISAQALGFEQTGVIAPGYRANVVLVRDDPLAKIGAVEAPAGVMIRGRWFDESGIAALKESAKKTSLVRSLWRALELRRSLKG